MIFFFMNFLFKYFFFILHTKPSSPSLPFFHSPPLTPFHSLEGVSSPWGVNGVWQIKLRQNQAQLPCPPHIKTERGIGYFYKAIV